MIYAGIREFGDNYRYKETHRPVYRGLSSKNSFEMNEYNLGSI